MLNLITGKYAERAEGPEGGGRGRVREKERSRNLGVPDLKGRRGFSCLLMPRRRRTREKSEGQMHRAPGKIGIGEEESEKNEDIPPFLI
jgi:hypothetical protein